MPAERWFVMRKLLAIIPAVALCAAMAVPAGAVDLDPRLYPPDADINGGSYPEWLARWSIWFNELPLDVNPVVDIDSPENCSPQDGGVVFAGPLGANCSVPEGMGIALSTVGWECSTAEGLGDTFAELRKCERQNFALDFGPNSSDRYRMWLDGVRVSHRRAWTFLTSGEIIDFPEDNIWGAVPGPSKSVTKAILYVFRPMSVGDHRVLIKGSNDVIGSYRFVWKFHVKGYGS